MAITVSLPDSLRGFLQEEMSERGDENLDACAARLIERAKRGKPPHKEFEAEGEFKRTRAALAERLPTPGFYENDSDWG